MLKKTIKYVDFDGNEQTDDFYFNLTETELTRLNASYPNGLANYIQHAIRTGNATVIMPLFENIILSAYGEKSFDGKRFIKSEQAKEEFMQTMAYDTLVRELLSDSTGRAAMEFLSQIIPTRLADQVRASNNNFIAN